MHSPTIKESGDQGQTNVTNPIYTQPLNTNDQGQTEMSDTFHSQSIEASSMPSQYLQEITRVNNEESDTIHVGAPSIPSQHPQETAKVNKEELRARYVDWLRTQRSTFTPPPYVIYDAYNNPQDPHVHPIDINHTIEFIWSRMGSGKTQALLKYLITVTNLFPSVIIVTSKQSYATFIKTSIDKVLEKDRNNKALQKLKFVNYLEGNVRDADFIIVQAESLFKVNRPYDIVIIDECTSFLKQMDSKLHGVNLMDNRDKFDHLIRDAKRIVCMDADIDSRSLERIHDLRSNDQIYLQHNRNRRGGRRIIKFNKNQEMYCWEVLWQSLEQKKNVNICLGTAKYGQRLEKDLKERKINYAFFWKDNHIKKALAKLKEEYERAGNKAIPTINDLWVKYQVVMFTSAICVGIDFNVPHFHCQFVFGHSMTNNVREMKQMMGRVRELYDNIIYVWNTTRKDFFPFTYDRVRSDFLKKADLNSELAQKYLTPVERELHLVDGKYIYEIRETGWTKLTFQNIVEDNCSRNFYDELFVWMLEDQDYEIVEFQPSIEMSEREETMSVAFKNHQKEVTKQIKQDEIAMFNDAPIVSYDELKTASQTIEAGYADRETVKLVQKNTILNRISDETQLQEVTGEEIYDAHKHSIQVFHARIELDLTVRDQLFNDLFHQDKDPLFSKYHYIIFFCNRLGVTNTLDRTTEIPCSRIRDNFIDIQTLFDNIKLIFNLKCVRPKDFSAMKKFIDSVLRSWSGSSLLVKHKRERRVRLRDYTIELLRKYNVDTIDKVPPCESTFKDNSPDDIVRPTTYIYVLKPPTSTFDQHVSRLSKLISFDPAKATDNDTSTTEETLIKSTRRTRLKVINTLATAQLANYTSPEGTSLNQSMNNNTPQRTVFENDDVMVYL